jgi:hypothetical protein
VKFFFDNNLAPKLAHGLSQMVEPEHCVVHLKDDFPANVEDVVWMRALAKETNLVIVTADIRISRNPHEAQAWKQAGHTVFFLKPGWVNLPFWDQANKFTKCFPDLIREAERAARGSAYIVTVNGKIEPFK